MTTIAGDLVRAFGDVDTMQQMYADDIVWQLPAALGPAAGPHRGKDAVLGFNTAAWSQFYLATGVSVDIHDELEQGDVSVARFTYRAIVAADGAPYENEYMLLARARDGKIIEVYEFFDSLKTMHYAGLRAFAPPIPGVTDL